MSRMSKKKIEAEKEKQLAHAIFEKTSASGLCTASQLCALWNVMSFIVAAEFPADKIDVVVNTIAANVKEGAHSAKRYIADNPVTRH